MLLSINIKNIVLIDTLSLDFKKGYTALTGETGAGKSIILSALGIILGKKADSSVIRFGQSYAEVTAEFKPTKIVQDILQKNDIDSEQLIIRRKITSDGKSKIFINDIAVSLKFLAELTQNLIEIHSQHEQSMLLDSSKQRELIDKFAKLEPKINQLSGIYSSWHNAQKDLLEATKKLEQAKAEEDYLEHVLEEINQFAPIEGEEEKLADKRRLMMDYEKNIIVIQNALNELRADKNVEAAIIQTQKILTRANNDCFKNTIDCLERALIEISDSLQTLNNLASESEYSETELDKIEARLFAIRDLSRKYECHPDQLPNYKIQIENALNKIKHNELEIVQKKTLCAKLEQEYNELASQISAIRKQTAIKLENALSTELKVLAMPETKFKVNFIKSTPAIHGIDKIEFLASTNKGTPISSLAEIASGGEISRFMLALKVVLVGASTVPIVIFDEIDTGTGGAVAASIGDRLAKLGKILQVFVVTHLPQVAACADNHLKVSKKHTKNSNTTHVQELSGTAKKEELARMLSGTNITPEARAAAEKLLTLSSNN